MSSFLNEDFWTSRYKNNETGWDIGEASKPLKQYLDQIENYKLNILIPGAGNGYEAKYALEKGFIKTHILDISTVPLENFQLKSPNFPKNQIYNEDFFDHQGQYDLILEQTFFCAIDPELRSKYIMKMADLLAPKGKLVGVLFNRSFPNAGPPFGGFLTEYQRLFETHFRIHKMENCYNSIVPRTDQEIFINLEKL